VLKALKFYFTGLMGLFLEWLVSNFGEDFHGLLKVLETLDAVLDVGGVYDPSRDRYDHHQKGFHEVFGHGFTTKLSSAGLVYKVYCYKIPSFLHHMFPYLL